MTKVNKIKYTNAYLDIEGIKTELSKNDEGYVKLAGGIIIQWGYFSGTGVKNFPIPFPNKCFCVLSDGAWNSASNPAYKTLSGISMGNITKEGFQYGSFGYIQTGNYGENIYSQSYRNITPAPSFGGRSYWIAIGN